jgi:CRP/FNR family cyclic AMP-dependent transcriptional regulator
MIERFRDRRRLLDALAVQQMINGDAAIAEAFADVLELRQYAAGEALIAQGAVDDHVCLIFAGGVDIVVNGRPVAKRHPGEQVGEMALLSPDSRRSATVVATDITVIGCVSEEAFSRMAERWPILWRRVASSLADRLKQRGQYVRQRNDTPIMFVGSSKEGLEVARGLQSGLAHENLIVRVWTDQVFGPSAYALEDLEREVAEADFGVLVLTADDRIVSRGEEQEAPRDNVIFELGMLIGAIGRTRTYFVTPRGQDVRIPSDLFGMNPLTYVPGVGRDLAARLGPVCTSLREKVRDLGPL